MLRDCVKLVCNAIKLWGAIKSADGVNLRENPSLEDRRSKIPIRLDVRSTTAENGGLDGQGSYLGPEFSTSGDREAALCEDSPAPRASTTPTNIRAYSRVPAFFLIRN